MSVQYFQLPKLIRRVFIPIGSRVLVHGPTFSHHRAFSSAGVSRRSRKKREEAMDAGESGMYETDGVRVAVEGCVRYIFLSYIKPEQIRTYLLTQSTGTWHTRRHLLRRRPRQQGARLGWCRPAHYRRRFPGRAQRRRPLGHVGADEV